MEALNNNYLRQCLSRMLLALTEIVIKPG